jgi:hypothetical protein
MYVFPATHFKVHAANEPGGPCRGAKAFADVVFALGGVCFL